MYYHNPITDSYAKVLGVDNHTQIATVIIDGQTQQMPWEEFIHQFRHSKLSRPPPNLAHHPPQ